MLRKNQRKIICEICRVIINNLNSNLILYSHLSDLFYYSVCKFYLIENIWLIYGSTKFDLSWNNLSDISKDSEKFERHLLSLYRIPYVKE